MWAVLWVGSWWCVAAWIGDWVPRSMGIRIENGMVRAYWVEWESGARQGPAHGQYFELEVLPRDQWYQRHWTPRWSTDVRGVEMLVPFWLPLAVTVVPTAWLWWGQIRRRRAARREMAGRCTECGYDRSLLADAKCPECGTVPLPPRTYSAGCGAETQRDAERNGTGEEGKRRRGDGMNSSPLFSRSPFPLFSSLRPSASLRCKLPARLSRFGLTRPHEDNWAVRQNRPSAVASHSRDRWSFLSRLLAKAREDAHLSQRALAKRLHRPQSFVAKYERVGRRLSVKEFMEVCAAVGCDAPGMLRALCKSVPALGRGGCG